MNNFLQLLINFFKALFGAKNKPIEETTTQTNNNSSSNGTSTNNTDKPNNTNTVDNNETNINTDMGKYNGKVILLDNGHAQSTSGKRSPLFSDGKTRFFEYEFNRDIVKRIASKLDALGIKYHILVPEVKDDIGLTVRANRANKYCDTYGRNNCLFISVHANAAGNGEEWKNARGWSIYTTKGVTKSDEIATIFFEEASKLLPKYNMTLRKDMSDGDPDYEENFTVIYKAACPAILTENLFYDNKTDVNFLMSNTGRNIIADIHVNAIKRVCGLA